MTSYYEPPDTADVTPVSGLPTTMQMHEVTDLNPDGTINTRPLTSRAGKAAVEVPRWYRPTRGDRVLIFYLDGHPQKPHAMPWAATPASPKAPVLLGPTGTPLA